MQMPSTVHPKTFIINGYGFKVISYAKLTDRQATAIVGQFYYSRKFYKKDKGKTFTIVTTYNENSVKYLGV